jgi:hypothetical protein
MALNLAGILYLGWRFRDTDVATAVSVETASRDLGALVREIERHREQRGAYPGSLAAFGSAVRIRRANVYDATAGLFRRRLYEYRLSSDGRTYDLFSAGPDGIAFTDDDVRPTLPDSIARASGYRAGR